MKKITSESDYEKIMAKIDGLMALGSDHVSKDQLTEIRKLALAAQEYEQHKYTLEAPTTLTGMIEMRMFEMRLKQKELAKRLKISESKLSLIMKGKQKPDLKFLKSVHSELNIDAKFILEHA
ncbi:HTH-type transcriptional regulator/antitoxin HigA [Anseongella ginsenosidimutans]|uniref:HTH-type transcriptional regulator/antitoxin HigA n=1 Tax=Anseongella ginsenosidimutans TaxID=496056 RepID=A0A4R3KPV6_9SPHI|nr:helix-turn-helix transcriptional regulator [Anseongella ginsenosidimutans]QEC52474.1 helix-turn-helix domain-containing protein [Anseongella ginsenosidimutans]TCS85348.1 HTH-type transcriptional regulator/antitoxin HigA [Anseongella ginsenosidimutans]